MAPRPSLSIQLFPAAQRRKDAAAEQRRRQRLHELELLRQTAQESIRLERIASLAEFDC